MLRKTVGSVGSLAQEAVVTAVNVAKHPIGSASLAVGLVKGAAGAGDRPGPERPAPGRSAARRRPRPTATPRRRVDPDEAPAPPAEDPRDEIPGPDLAHFEPPRPRTSPSRS